MGILGDLKSGALTPGFTALAESGEDEWTTDFLQQYKVAILDAAGGLFFGGSSGGSQCGAIHTEGAGAQSAEPSGANNLALERMLAIQRNSGGGHGR